VSAEPLVERIVVARFRCPHCRRSWSSKQAASVHVERCWHNPAARSCKTCANYEPAGDGSQCVPGRRCSCNIHNEACAAGIGLADGLVSDCPSYQRDGSA
jgi:hypothetical protein